LNIIVVIYNEWTMKLIKHYSVQEIRHFY